uniref:Amphiregulin n=1 Tax=Leptobrachium leishanense TaxID=445787 RepID=A0A8C5N353_9ANUR
MPSHLSLLLCITVLCTLACNYRVYSLENNTTTTTPTNATLPEDHHVTDRMRTTQESSLYEEDEETDDDFSITGYIIDDSIRVQPVVKPEDTKKKGEKKKGEKKKKGQNEEKKKKGQNEEKKKKGQNEKKKKDPCQTTHKDFCIHGECKYLANVEEVSCKCQKDYFGERCSEQYLKTKSTGDFADVSTTALAVTAVLLSTISIIAVIIIIIIHTRRKYSSYECEAEEKKRLGQENGSEEIDV